MPEMTTEKFDEMLKRQSNYDVLYWHELEENKIYTIIKFIRNPDHTMLLNMSEGFNVIPPHPLYDTIGCLDTPPPYYVRPLGERLKHNYAFELVVPDV